MEVAVSIQDEVSSQMKDAMRARDKVRLSALRNIRAGIIAALKEDGSETLADDKALVVLKRLARQRRDSIDSYTAADRADLAAQEQAELDVIAGFLPTGPDETTMRAWVEEAIAATGASSPRDMGKVMGSVMRAHKGEADGATVRRLASELLAG